MWGGIAFVGLIMAAGTLLVLDYALPGGLIEGSGDLPYARTMAFTTLMLFQLFNVLNARSDEQSAFQGLFTNPWLWGAVLLSLDPAVGRGLRAALAASLRHRGPELRRLAPVRRGRQLRALAARGEQALRARRDQVADRQRTERRQRSTISWARE